MIEKLRISYKVVVLSNKIYICSNSMITGMSDILFMADDHDCIDIYNERIEPLALDIEAISVETDHYIAYKFDGTRVLISLNGEVIG